MDNLSLHIIFLEIEDALEGKNLVSIHEPDLETLLLYFDEGRATRLLLSARPGHPRVHISKSLVGGEKREKSPFAALLTKSLQGLFVRKIEKNPRERLIRFGFSSLTGKENPDFILMFELIGRSSNIILTDGTERVLGYARVLKSEFRQPVFGSPYQPPIRLERSVSDPTCDSSLDDEVSASPEKADEFLRETLKGAPEAMVQEIVQRVSREGRFSRVVQDILEAHRRGLEKSYIYSIFTLDALPEDCQLTRDNFILSPIRIGSPGRLVESGFDKLNDAADRYFSILLRNESFAARKSSILKLVKREIERAETILGKLEKDRMKFDNAADFKRFAELILARMNFSAREGDRLEVEDIYHPGKIVRIPIDPSLPLSRNADLYFRRYQRAQRGMRSIEKRSRELEKRLSDIKNLGERIGPCGSSDALEPLMEEMRSAGIAAGIRDKRKRSVVSADHLSGIRIYKSSDGLQILVGKSARENMKLSFKIASPEDFWLHASAHGGSHVVVKNPSGLRKLPERTLREAAQLAAFFSSGKGETKVEVHHTKKKYVRKAKNLPAGAVIVKKFESIQVKPELPKI